MKVPCIVYHHLKHNLRNVRGIDSAVTPLDRLPGLFSHLIVATAFPAKGHISTCTVNPG